MIRRIAAAILLATSVSAQTTWYVDAGGTPPGSGSQSEPYTSIQFAIDQPATQSGDTLAVQAGVYLENIDLSGKALRIAGSGLQNTILDGGANPQLPVVSVTTGEGPGTALEDLTVRGGAGAGGVVCDFVSLRITRCSITGNTCTGPAAGGGITAFATTLELQGTRIVSNTAIDGSNFSAGGMSATGSLLTIDDCTVNDNRGDHSGGVVLDSCATSMSNSSIASNVGVTGRGGGLAVYRGSILCLDAAIDDNRMQDGEAGGVSLDHCSAEFVDTTLRRNRVDGFVSWTEHAGGAGIISGFIGLGFNTSASFRGCVISDNSALAAGAFELQGSHPDSGAVDVVFDNCTFLRNEAREGGRAGAIASHGALLSVQIDDCRFTDNSCTDFGGAIFTQAPLTIRGSRFENNTSELGGAIFAGLDHPVVIDDTWFVGNSATAWSGGAVAAHVPANPLMLRCVFEENSARFGGATIGGTLEKCTLVGNVGEHGGACYASTLNSCIVVQNGADPFAGPTTVRYSNVEGGAAGTGNFDADPRFWSAASSDFRLLPGSPCIDAGDPMVPCDPDGTRADAGAFPFDPAYCGPGCTGAIGSSYCTATVNSSGSPGTLTALGSTDLSENLVLLNAVDLPVQQFGYFLMSDTQGFLPMLGGGQGNLCLDLPIVRFDVDVLFTGILGEVSYQVDVANLPQSMQFQVGETWNFQLWFRDINPNFTSNTSDGVAITWQ